MKDKRENSFDYLRVISMFMVIIVHVSNVYSRSYGVISDWNYIVSLIFNTISRVSVPIFLMISGALLLDRKFDFQKYWKRIVKFFLLIVVWDSIYLYWEYFYLGNLYEPLYKLLFEPFRAHLWFLYTIIILYLLQPIMKIVLDKCNKTMKYILLGIWVVFSTLSLFNSTIANVFTLFSYMGYFIVGKYIYDFVKQHVKEKHNNPLMIIMVICMIVSISLNFLFSLKYDNFYNLFFAYRTPFIMIASMAFFAFVVTNYKKENPKLLEVLSEGSLGVYLIHGIFLDIAVRNFPYYSIPAIIGIPLYSAFIFVMSATSVYFLRKINFLKDFL